MNKKLIAVALLTCISISLVSVQSASAQTCSTVRVGVIIDDARLEVIPREPKCAFPDSKVVVWLLPASNAAVIPPGGVETEGKLPGGSDAWLDGTNGVSGIARFKITLDVPAGTPSGTYAYKITVPGVGVLDPVVRVVDSVFYREVFDSEVRTMGFDPKDVLDVADMENADSITQILSPLPPGYE